MSARSARSAQYLSTAPAEVAPQFLELGVLEATGDADKREVAGLLLPYDQELERTDWLTGASKQKFAQGSAVVRDNAALFYGHDHLTKGLPIGRITAHEHTPEGLRVTARISKTAKGDEVYTLLRDGVLTKFSAGFYPGKAHLEDGDSTLVHDSVDVFEGSVVPDPAYQSADVDSVLGNHHHQKETVMPCTKCGQVHPAGVTDCQATPAGLASADDVQTLSTAVEDLTRKVATLGHTGPELDGPVVPYSSYGEFLQGIARGEKDAADFLAYVGGTVADLGTVLKDSWVGDRFKFIEAQRTTLNLFSRSPLPAEGMGVEYGVEGTDTTQVTKQAAEGDVLAYGKLTFSSDRAPLETFGGWGEMSFQQIQRSPLNVVERYFASLLRRYAQTTEAKVNTAVQGAGITTAGGVVDLSTSDGWIKFLIRSARELKNVGYPMEFLTVSWDMFENLALMRDGAASSAPRLLDRDSGTVSITGLKGEMFTIPIVPIETGATTGVVRACNSEAIRTYEAPGVPFRLQDDDITKLTHAASVYGYMATALEVPKAIRKPQTS